MLAFCPGTLKTVGKSRQRRAWPKRKCFRKCLRRSMYSILLLMLATVGLSIFAARRQLPQKWFRWCILSLRWEKQIDPFLKWKYKIYMLGAPQTKNRWNWTDRSNRGGPARHTRLQLGQECRKSYDQRGSLSPGPRLEWITMVSKQGGASVAFWSQWPTVGAKATTSRRMTYHFMSGILRDGFISSIRGPLMTGSWRNRPWDCGLPGSSNVNVRDNKKTEGTAMKAIAVIPQILRTYSPVR